MSAIDEIKEALGKCERRPDRMNFAALELMIVAALADARREGAEAMREAIAHQAEINALYGVHGTTVSTIRAMPLPTGPRQAVRHVGDSQFEQWFSMQPWSASTNKQHCRDSYAAGMGDGND